MAKLKHLFTLFFFLTLLVSVVQAQPFSIKYQGTDVDSVALKQQFGLQTTFPSRTEALNYIGRLSALLQTKGYITASLDSIRIDSLGARINLFVGRQYRWARVVTMPSDAALLQAVQWPESSFTGPVNFTLLQTLEQRILEHLEDNGHPFGKVYLDSIELQNDAVLARLRIEQGPLYKIDSIQVFGNVKLSKEFLQRYLDIENGSYYNRKKLQQISKKLRELPYVDEYHVSDLSLLSTGAVLNLYIKPKRSSQINALFGFSPNTAIAGSSKLLLTVDANLLLQNALGSGETIALVWQQLQQRSPQLHFAYQKPYVFHSPFGSMFSFDMFRRDSVYLNIDGKAGVNYRIQDRQSATVFLEASQTIVNGLDLNQILNARRLPQEADVSSLNLGTSYAYISTDYRFNPRKGSEFTITATGGNKTVKKNSAIVSLKDPNDPNFSFASLYDTVKLKVYQIRVVAAASHFIPVGKQSTVKLGVQGGWYQSPSIYRNELFLIGGYRLLRGFNEESQYVSQYAIGTLEYRYRLGLNSYFFGFVDGGWGKHLLELVQNHTYLGTGLGLSFEIKAGIINLAWAVGRRDDTEINLRQSKIHVGFVSYF